MTVQEAINLAMEHQNAGRLNEAEVLYRQVLGAAPDHPEALNWLGAIALQCGALDPARQLISRAIEVAPNYAEAYCNLGDVLATAGDMQGAADAYQKAIDLRPNFVEAVNNLGTVLADLGRVDEAMAAYRKARELQPGSPQPWCNISQALLGMHRTDEALAAARESLARDDRFADAHNNLGAGMLQKGEVDGALRSFRHAAALKNDFPLAHANLAMVLLLKGQFEEGWREYEWRLRVLNSHKFAADLGKPQWNGEPLNGRRIFLHAEQGFGDVIHFARYIPMVIARGGRVSVGCHPPLRRLLARMPGVEACIVRGEPLPEFDVHCPFPSLSGVFETTLSTIPANVPYIHADPSLSAFWRNRLGEERRRKIGLVWAGRPEHTNDRNRSIPLETLAPMIRGVDARWMSLQKGEAGSQLRSNLPVTDWTGELNDFNDTAALIDNLDLVLTVDTAVAHLAGAMGKPVWVLLPAVPDWRWMLGRKDSPWYPTMRLFRQAKTGNWDDVIQKIAASLSVEFS